MLLNVLNYFFEENSILLIHILNLFVLLILVILFISARKTGKKWTRINDYLGTITKTVNSVRYGDLTKKVGRIELPNAEPLAESINRMIETLYDREKMIVEYQNELHRQNKFLEAVINSLSDGLVIIDENHRILRATPKISEWFGISGKKLVGTPIDNYIVLPERAKIESLKENDIYIKANRASNFSASSMELKLEDRKRRHIIIIKNITDQKELENLKEDFVATLTHDLKVPIIAETNMLELFLNESFGPVSEKQEIALKNMQVSNKELLDLVQIVLETYKYRDGNISLYKENIMLRSFINEIVDEMEPISIKNNNKLKFSSPRDIRVYADRIQLKRVIKNLIQNAISYGEPNFPIEISIGEIPQYIVIKVKDYGAGISQADIDKIFNKYYSAAKKFRKIGTGLGLYLALQIVKGHGGELAVESEEGKFTEFTIKLPAVMNINLHYGE
mgnify:FL=1